MSSKRQWLEKRVFVWDPIERWELGDPDPGPERSPSADRAKLVQAMALQGWTEVALHRGDADSRIEFVRPLLPDPASVQGILFPRSVISAKATRPG